MEILEYSIQIGSPITTSFKLPGSQIFILLIFTDKKRKADYQNKTLWTLLRKFSGTLNYIIESVKLQSHRDWFYSNTVDGEDIKTTSGLRCHWNQFRL